MKDINDFLDYLLIDKKYSDNTIESYKNDLYKFYDFLKKDMTNVTENDINNYLMSLKKNGSNDNITIVCESGNLGDSAIEMIAKVTAIYSKDRIIQTQKTEITETVHDKNTYQTRKETYSNSYAQRENNDTTEYNYSYNDQTNTFKYSTYLKEIDLNALTEDEKTNYQIHNFLKLYEDSKYTCNLSGISKADLGLE